MNHSPLSEYTTEELLRLREQARQQQSMSLPEVANESGIGFFDRAAASFGGSEQERENILRTQGLEPTRTSSGELGVVRDGRRYPVDEPGLSFGDVADFAGDLPSGILGALGGFAGMGAPVPGATFAGAAGGAAAGDMARQGIGRILGSGAEEMDMGSIAAEGALGAAGEGVGRVAGRVLSGPFRRGTQAPDFAKTTQQLRDFDTRFGTNTEGLAPADVLADSDFLGSATQRVRESQFGGQGMREGQDVPFRRELAEGFDRIAQESGAAGPPGTAGPFAERVGESQAGRGLKEAAGETLQQRRAQERGLYDTFRGQIDPTATPELDNTMAAIQEIMGTNILRRGKTGGQGLETLRGALEEVDQIDSFDKLEMLRQAVGDEIDTFDPARMSRGVQSQLKRLRAALRADEEAFLEAGGGLRETKRVFHGTSGPDFDAFRPAQSGPEAGTIMFSDSPAEAAEFSGPLGRGMDALQGRGERVIPAHLRMRDPLKVDAEGELFEPDMMAQWIQEAREAGNDGIVIRNIQNFETGDLSNTYVVFEPSQVRNAFSPSAKEAGQKARRFSRTLFDLDEASAPRRVFRDDLKAADIPENLRGMNADEIRSIRQAVGAESAGGGVGATSQGMEAWNKIGAEVLDDLKAKARNPDLSTADELVISGNRLQTELNRYKPGALEEIFGPETANALRNYADMVRNATVSERQFANTSRTGMANQSIMNDLAGIFRSPVKTGATVMGRIAAETGMGKVLGSQGGKRYLLGQAGFQQRPGLLELLGRFGGQGLAQGGQSALTGR